jgi:hypothetical protein
MQSDVKTSRRDEHHSATVHSSWRPRAGALLMHVNVDPWARFRIFAAKMMSFKTYDECNAYRGEHHRQMEVHRC